MNTTTTEPSPILWGAGEIGAAIGRSARSTFHLLETGKLPVARKVGGTWTAHRETLIQFFRGEPADRTTA